MDLTLRVPEEKQIKFDAQIFFLFFFSIAHNIIISLVAKLIKENFSLIVHR